MNILRRLALSAAFSLLSVLLLSFGLVLSLVLIASNPETIKSIVRASNVYDLPVSKLLVAAGDSTVKTGDALATPQVRQALDAAFPPAIMTQHTEAVIDGLHAWLKGATPTPLFKIDLNPQMTAFADNVAASAGKHLEALPACKPGQTVRGTVFDWTCRPAGADVDAVVTEVKDDFLRQEGLQNATFTANSLKDAQGRPLTEQLKGAPDAYLGLITLAYAQAAVIALIVVGLLVRPLHRKARLRRIGTTVLFAGLFSYAAAWTLSFLGRNYLRTVASEQNGNTALGAAISVAGEFMRVMTTYWGRYSLALVGIGLLILLPFMVLWVRRRGQKGQEMLDGNSGEASQPALSAREQRRQTKANLKDGANTSFSWDSWAATGTEPPAADGATATSADATKHTTTQSDDRPAPKKQV